MTPAEVPMPPDGEDALERARWYVSVDPDGIDVFGSKSMIEILARYDDQARQLQEAQERVAASLIRETEAQERVARLEAENAALRREMQGILLDETYQPNRTLLAQPAGEPPTGDAK